jgi:hypothetical protein
MKRVLKWMFILAGIGGALFIALGFWFRAQYPPERLRRIAADKLGEKLGRQVEIDDASLSLVHGVTLKGVKISEFPSFSAGTFIDVRQVRVFLRLVPLLSRQIMIRSIDLEHPHIRVKRGTDGTFNFADLTTPPPTPSTQTPAGGVSPKTFFISRATISNGHFSFRDDSLNLNVGLNAMDINLSGFSLTNPFGLNAQGALEVVLGTAAWKGPLALKANLSPVGDSPITVESLRLGLETSSLELKGTITPLPSPHAEVTLILDRLNETTVAPFVTLPEALKGTHLSGTWNIRASTSVLNLEGTFDAQGPDITLQGSVTSRTWAEPDGFHHSIRIQPKSFRLDGSPLAPTLTGSGPLGGQWDIRASSDQWNVSGTLSADAAMILYDGWLEKPTGAPFAVTGSAKSSGSRGPTFTMDLRVPQMLITPGGPWPEKLNLKGTVGVTAEAQGVPSDLAFDVSADGLEIEATYGETFQKPKDTTFVFEAAGRLRNQKDAQLTSASVRTAAGTLDIQGRINDLTNRRQIDLTINGKQDLAHVSKRIPSLLPYRLRGEAALRATVKGPASDALIEGDIELNTVSLTAMSGVELVGLNGKTHFTPKRAHIKSVKGTAFGSPFTLTAQIENFDRPTIVLDGDWARLEVEKVLKIFSATPSPDPHAPTKPEPPGPAPIAHIAGIFRIGEITHPHYIGRNFQFKWNLHEMGPNLSVLSGTATVTAATGEIKNIPVAKKINKLMGRDGSDITYKKLSGRFQVTQGVAAIQPFTLDSDQTDFFANGKVRLGDMDSDLNLMLKLPPGSVRGSVGNWLTAEDGRPTIEAHLEGPLGNPQVKVNKGDVIRRAAKDILKKTLGGWKGKPDRPSNDPTETTAPPPQKEQLEEMGIRALENLFKKK